ncbi:transposase [Streptomyces sp. NPDC059092]|uniref:transposase n=1 Tax=Streptomyces sp. NPDC059092 TaxID=3346725 RepID=UPI00367C28C8
MSARVWRRTRSTTWTFPRTGTTHRGRADAGYGDATGFRQGLTDRGPVYAVAVKGSTTCHPGDAVPQPPAYRGQGRPPGVAYQQPHTTLRTLAMTAGRQTARTVTPKIRWRVEHDYRELKDGLGLDHLEGRSYLGRHRHVALTALAQAFCTLLRISPKVPAPA